MKIWHLFDTAGYLIISHIYCSNNKAYSDEKHIVVMQFLKFCFVGISNAVVYYIAYAGSLLLLREESLFCEFDYQVSQMVGFVVSVFWAFSINRNYVFSNTNVSYIKAIGRFYLTYSFTGIFMNSVLLFVWKELGISVFIGPVINIFFTTPVNYILTKKWAFRQKDSIYI